MDNPRLLGKSEALPGVGCRDLVSRHYVLSISASLPLS
jgi:hypothetical protein